MQHSFNFAAKEGVVTKILPGKKLIIGFSLLLAMTGRLPARGMPGEPLRKDTIIAAADTLRNDTVRQTIAVPETRETQMPGDTLKSDTLLSPAQKTKPVPLPGEEAHSPRKASVYSAILPGLGQAYNKKYWKIPIIYGGFAAFGYFIGWNNKNFLTAKKAYSDLTDTIPGTDSFMKLKQIIYYDLNKASDVASLKQGLISSQNYFRRNRDLLIIVTVAFYGLNIIDASVDAHFFNFDISDDLTFNWQPELRQTQSQHIFCLNCSFRF